MSPDNSSIGWLPLLLLAAGVLVMLYLLKRKMRGMNQQDWILLRKARSRGVDVTQPQPVEFAVFAATEATAADLAEKMRREGFETSIKEAQIQFARRNKPGKAQEGWLISGKRLTHLVPETLIGTRKMLTEISTEQKALYLGWQIADAAAQPPAAQPHAAQKAASEQQRTQ